MNIEKIEFVPYIEKQNKEKRTALDIFINGKALSENELKKGSIGIINARTFLNYQRNSLLLKKQFNYYGPFYAYATEDIGRSLSSYGENDRILTILSSGDHVFNYLLKGAVNIETFDINKVTKYYFELKKACLSKLSYDEFIAFQSDKKSGILINALKRLDEFAPFLDKDTYLFWRYYIENTDLTNLFNATINKDGMFSRKYNLYFEKTNYEKLQSILKSGVSFTFHHSDVSNLPLKIDGKFSEMHFSNLFSYFDSVASSTSAVVKTINGLNPFLEEGGKMLFYSINGDMASYENLPLERKNVNERDLILTYRK